MIDEDLKEMRDTINNAASAEDVFGELKPYKTIPDRLELLDSVYSKIKGNLNPDNFMDFDSSELVKGLLKELKDFYESAKIKISENFYGAKNPHMVWTKNPSFKTEKRSYYLGPEINSGDISTIYSGESEFGDIFSGKVIIKVANDPIDNNLIQHELNSLNKLFLEPKAQVHHLPQVLDTFLTLDKRLGIVFKNFGGYPLEEIKPFMNKQSCIPEKHMVWMLSRLLAVLGYSHNRGIIHGNIQPDHILIRPKDHNLQLIDWCWSSHSDLDKFKIKTEFFSPPELDRNITPQFSSDIYSAGMCMIYLLGGNIGIKEVPNSIHPEITRFLKRMVQESYRTRPQDAWELWHEFDKLKINLWGPKKFMHFQVN